MSGGWIQTFTGEHFPLDPFDSRKIWLADIAHHLSLVCRFNGAVRLFYSVAQHSVLASRLVPAEHALEALLHDATEAYLADLNRPAKALVPDYGALEKRLEAKIAERFGLRWPWDMEIRKVDNVLLVTEARDLLVHPPSWLGDFAEKPLGEHIVPWTAYASEQAFLERFSELWLERYRETGPSDVGLYRPRSDSTKPPHARVDISGSSGSYAYNQANGTIGPVKRLATIQAADIETNDLPTLLPEPLD